MRMMRPRKTAEMQQLITAIRLSNCNWASSMRRLSVMALWAAFTFSPPANADEWTLVHKGEHGVVYAGKIRRTEAGATLTSKTVLAEFQTAHSRTGDVQYRIIVADDEVRCKDRSMTTTKIGLVTPDGAIMLEKPPPTGTYRSVPFDQTVFTADAVLFRFICQEHVD